MKAGTIPPITSLLTPYELNCKPLEHVPDDSVCYLDANMFGNGILTCVVCLSILRNTRTVMKCLHRFCDKCIVDSLRKGKKECPACRVKIASHRDLRQESRIDFLLGTLLGDLDHYEDMQTQRFERITKTLNIQALRTSVEEGLKRQATAKRKRYSSDLPEKLPPKKRKFVAVELNRHPTDTTTEFINKRFICIPDETTVKSLCKYVVKQLSAETPIPQNSIKLKLQTNADTDNPTFRDLKPSETLSSIISSKKFIGDTVIYYLKNQKAPRKTSRAKK